MIPRMGSWRCLAVAGWLLAASACNDSAAELECEPEQTQPLELVMEPPPPTEGGSRSLELRTACVVASLSDAPASLRLSCADRGEPIEFALAAAGLTSAELGSGLLPGDAVELEYATIADVARAPAWAAVRRTGELAPKSSWSRACADKRSAERPNRARSRRMKPSFASDAPDCVVARE